MDWTTDMPTDRGWYWVISPQRYKPALKKVTITWRWKGEVRLSCGGKPLEEMKGYAWCGPIQPPAPPE